jgi:hypothetical protein
MEFSSAVYELLYETLGEEWYIELAKPGAKHSYALRKSGNQAWSDKGAKKLVKDDNDYEFIGTFSEATSPEGPILMGVVYHCTESYLKKSPYMYFEKKDACKRHLRTGKPEEYIEG